jgi:ASC-1-like (ASCH) protein
MHLHLAPFERILSGKQTIEARLNDEKRRELKVGDIIEFTLRDDASRSFKVKIIELLLYKNFRELYISEAIEEFGGENLEQLLTSIHKYFSEAEEVKYGVLGIKLEII